MKKSSPTQLIEESADKILRKKTHFTHFQYSSAGSVFVEVSKRFSIFDSVIEYSSVSTEVQSSLKVSLNFQKRSVLSVLPLFRQLNCSSDNVFSIAQLA